MDQSPIYDSFPSSSTQQYSHIRHSPITTSSSSLEANLRQSASSLASPQQKKHLRFHIVLQASTAVTQKTEESSLTYLNRGQAYGIDLTDKLGYDGLIQSQLVIMFHDPSHQKVALSYWDFWINQQKDPQHARALDFDANQSVGIMNVRHPGFDRVSFDWHGRQGAKLFIRFHCLSTDFSRIKGVKGIPLRICMTSQVPLTTDPLLMRHYAGSFQSIHKDKMLDYIEQSYCRVKLFRDKGAERKNKDDAKQLGKQFEKLMHESDAKHHPMWLMYNESVPYSVFGEVPAPYSFSLFDHSDPRLSF
ncbi:CP2 transcription factor-domain-containing protein [Halteromyces radiatus]|uniref:CP2 transcription factor-domain-containing protein n=1 Tax=Halteromyces radiatus TaxID=101107 RepID=UPI002220D621|nr:CP2 transcription factor-domain-containing protein [Halteromyces radiatus]KAI8099118.1 CP2 transcription factor-domain-containing protein [Halteromyces radiatus]